MTAKLKCSKILPYVCGITMICLSVYLYMKKPHVKLVREWAHKEAALVKGKPGYDVIWSNIDVYFRVYIFDVMNADEIMEGAKPQFRERGPYVYDMNINKEVLSINEETDEMDYMTTRTYHFNKELSTGTEEDEVTIINSAYLGSIGTIISAFPSFLKKLGNDIQKLFPGMEDIFVRDKVGNVLFHGLPMECDVKKHKELKLICGFLMGKKPDGIKNTDVEGVYQWSFFNRLNGTAQGPLTVNRGVKNVSKLGDTTAFKGKRVQNFWKSDHCNRVVGTDSITWAPMETRWDRVFSYEPQICRWAIATFKSEVVLNGLVGWRYQLDKNSWQSDQIECYCPVVKRVKVCPTTGIMDLTPCQEAPIFYSEPHFLNGDPSLVDYAKGLSPNESIHSTYITIEPMSGAPLSGSKKLQLSAKLINSPVVELLANITEGYFPILWCEEAKDADLDSLASILQGYRLQRLFLYLTYVPLVAGIFIILEAIFLNSYTENRTNVEKFVSLESIQARRNPRIERSERSVTRRLRARVNPA